MAWNKERVEQWIAALESGKYKQTRGVLRRRDEFCCLGVACDISPCGTWTAAERYQVQSDTRGAACLMPMQVSEWFSLTSTIENKLMSMNDEGRPFPEIAAYLRQRLAEQESATA